MLAGTRLFSLLKHWFPICRPVGGQRVNSAALGVVAEPRSVCEPQRGVSQASWGEVSGCGAGAGDSGGGL